jgi:hypothetical protein
MSLPRPMASLTGALLVRSGNAVMAGWTMPLQADPPALSHERQTGSEGLRLVEKGQGRPSSMARDDETGPADGATMRVSFRIDAERHLRLRQAGLRHGSSQQQLLVAALDAYLGAYLGRDAAPVNAGTS